MECDGFGVALVVPPGLDPGREPDTVRRTSPPEAARHAPDQSDAEAVALRNPKGTTLNAEPNPPRALPQLLARSRAIQFGMASDPLTGSLLRTLAASKPAGRFLELGTGTGLATAWLLDGMDEASHLVTIESDPAVLAIACDVLGGDDRVSFTQGDGGAWLRLAEAAQFDLIFADAGPGKYSHLDEALGALKRGGLYVIDDMLPQPNWPAGHDVNVAELIATLEARADLRLTKLDWSTGIIIAAKIGEV
jgi:predicted O-methyltransferase YrrM